LQHPYFINITSILPPIVVAEEANASSQNVHN
jgi:hypothetical protein